MSRDSFISFNEYKDRVTGANIDKRSTSDLLKDLDEVEKQFTEGGATDGNRDISSNR